MNKGKTEGKEVREVVVKKENNSNDLELFVKSTVIFQ